MAIMRTFQLWLVFTIGAGFHLATSLALQGSDLLLDPTSSPPLPRPSQLDQYVSVTLEFYEEPQDTVVVRGQGAVFKCFAKSEQGKVNVTWFHEGHPISEKDTRWSTESDGSVLRVLAVTGGKRGSNGVVGNYSCLATNEAGSLKSRMARLRVASMDKDLTVSEDQEVHESQPLALLCSVHSVPPADVQWELNQLPLPKDERYVPLPNGTLILRSTKSSDTGSFRCIAINPLLNKTKHSREIRVKILPPPASFSSPSFMPINYLFNKTVLVGETAEFHCFMSGNPLPTIQWYKGDTLLPNQKSPILTISQANPIDSGSYSCTAVNSVGQISQKFHLNVYERPTFIVTPISMSSPAAKTIRLNCSAKGIPQPKIVWYKNGTPLAIEGRIKKQGTELIFTHTFTYDSGLYQCMALNAVGQIWTSAQIKINKSQNPDPPVDVKCRPFDDTTICLSWKNPSNEKLQAYSISSFYTDDNSPNSEYVVPAVNTYYEASELKKSTNYTFYIRSYTKIAGDNSESVVCQTGLKGSRNLTITQASSTSVLLKWDSLSTDVFCNGTKEYFKISYRQVFDLVSHVRTMDENYIINGLMPGADYEFSVSTESSAPRAGDWVAYSTPDVQDDGNYTSQDILQAPMHFQGEALSSTSVRLEWDSVTNARYYAVCYVPTNDQRNCQENEMLKSTSRSLKIQNLQSNTLYLFQIRAYDFDNIPGIISQPIQIETPSGVPSKVLNLQYQVLNASTVCIHWTPPKNQHKSIQNYSISYTPDINLPLEKWLVLNVSTENDGKNLRCGNGNMDNQDLISVVLSDITSDNEYMLVVTAVNEHGLGNPAMLTITPNASNNARENKSDIKENGRIGTRKSKIGIIIGILLALLAIAGCIVFVLLKRRCLKRHAFGRPRLATSSDYHHQPVAHYTTHLGAVQVKMEEPCSTHAHEIEHLVPDEHGEYISSGIPEHLDTKGGRDMPNGHINGRSKITHQNGHLPNGCVRIIENPQYMALEQNDVTVPPINHNHHYASDSNSNVKNSKFLDLHKLFEKSKNTSSCHPHFGESDSRGSSLCSLNGGSLNATQSTNLDESQLSHSCPNDSILSHDSTKLSQTLNFLNQATQSNSRLSPILVPNG